MFSSTSSFDRLLERATSNLLLEPDWNAIMAICDAIRSGDSNPKYAVSAIKKKFYHQNPHVVLYALQVMESCVKNCGSLVHDEIATKAFMEELREMVKHSTEENIRLKILEMLQTWGMAFRNSPKYRIVTETLNLMKAEGWKFPAVREAEAMFEADTAPDWADGDVCHRCRIQFGMMTRQHHCRACGQVFCSKCSSKTCAIPKFGIEREVRVCDTCFDTFGPKESSANGSATSSPMRAKKGMSVDDLPAEYLASPLSQQSQAPPAKSGGKSEEELKEEEELQLALALSQSEAQAKEDSKRRAAATYQAPAASASSPKKLANSSDDSKPGEAEEDISPELMRYLNRDYWEQKEKSKVDQQAKRTSSPVPPAAATTLPRGPSGGGSAKVEAFTEAASKSTALAKDQLVSSGLTAMAVGGGAKGGRNAEDEQLDEFVTTLKTQVEIFVNRMKSNSSRGRSITNDSSVQTLFMNTMAMHSRLLKHIQDQEDGRVHYEGLQDKIAQVKDARAALDALREEEKERKRREAEEAERLRQIQMREKLEVMRQKKQEYLQYQRQLALQRMQEQEREMKLRHEQVKQQYTMYHHQGPQAYLPQPPSMAGPPPITSPPANYPGAPPQSPMYPGHPQSPYMPPQHFMPPSGSGIPPGQQQQPGQPVLYNMSSMASALPPMPMQGYQEGAAAAAYQGGGAPLPGMDQQHQMTMQPPQQQQQMGGGVQGPDLQLQQQPQQPRFQQQAEQSLIVFD